MTDSAASSSTFTAPVLVCDVCAAPTATVTLHCATCALSLCHECARDRHSVGSLTQHSLTFIQPPQRPPPSVVHGYQCCDRCRTAVAILHCPICALMLCDPCADRFHSVGKGRRREALLYHKIKFEYVNIRDSDLALLPKPVTQSPRATLRKPPPVPAKLFISGLVNTLPLTSDTLGNSASSTIIVPTHHRADTGASDTATAAALGTVDESSKSSTNNTMHLSKLNVNANDDDSDSVSQSQPTSVPPSPYNYQRTLDQSPPPIQSDNELERRSLTLSQRGARTVCSSVTDIDASPVLLDRQRSSPAILRARSSSTSVSSSHSHSLYRTNSVSIPQTPPLPNTLPPFQRRGSEIVTGTNKHSSTTNLIKTAHLLSTAANPLSTLSQSQKMIGNRNHPTGGNEMSISKYKLCGYTLSTSSAKPVGQIPPPLTITIDPLSNTITVVNTNGLLYHTRHFSSLLMASHSGMGDQCFFTIYFNDARAVTAKCLSVTGSEAFMITELINSFIEQWNKVHKQHTDSDTVDGDSADTVDIADIDVNACLFAARIEKKSQLRWKPRWIRIQPFTLALFKTADLARSPDRTLHLRDVVVKTENGKDRERVIVLEQPEGKRTEIRCANTAERDTIVTVLARASQRKTGHDSEPTQSQSLTSSSHSHNEEMKASMSVLPSSPGPAQPRATLNEKTPPNIHIITSNLHSHPTPLSPSTGGRSIDHDNPHTPFSGGSGGQDVISPLSASNHQSHCKLGHHQQMRAMSRRRSRRSLSRDFHALSMREQMTVQTPQALLSPSHASSLTSPSRPPSTTAYTEWNEMLDDPREFQPFSSTLSVGIYAMIASLHASTMHGAYLSPTLYVPRTVWHQQGVKIPAFNLKCDMLEAMNEAIGLSNPPSSTSPTLQALQECDESLVNLRQAFESIQDRLAPHLPYIPRVTDSERVDKTHVLASQRSDTGMKKGMKQLSQWLDRVNVSATVTKKLDEGELTKYVNAIQQVLESSLIYRQWHSISDRLSADATSSDKLKETWQALNRHLGAIDEFLYSVLLVLVLSDLQLMVQRFVKYQHRALTGTSSGLSAATAINKMVKANRGNQR